MSRAAPGRGTTLGAVGRAEGRAVGRMVGRGLRAGDVALARVLEAPVWAYRVTLSPWMGRQCRYEPTCSRYAIEALRGHGGVRGAWLAFLRVLRCHPLARGGYDPPPIADRSARVPGSGGVGVRGEGE